MNADLSKISREELLQDIKFALDKSEGSTFAELLKERSKEEICETVWARIQKKWCHGNI